MIEVSERYRPLFHYTPARNWMNDPNGLVQIGAVTHLFYQYNPLGNHHGGISWGHATSTDLLHWQEQAVALPEREHQIFSGSAAVDWHNTSGFGSGGPPVVACYTGHRHGHEAQFLAYSQDQGQTWQFGGDAPVLDLGKADFRDPKIFWHPESGRWIMAVVHPDERQVELYGSADLHRWEPLSVFGPAGETGGIWEVPELFPLTDASGQTCWLLKVDLNPGGLYGGSGAQYWLGQFDGQTFTPATPARWVDHGKDFYAALAISDLPGRRVWIAWMSNWDYAHEVPTTPWRGSMTLPRELGVVQGEEGPVLTQRPVPELRTLRRHAQHLNREGIYPLAGQAHELLLRWERGTGRRLTLEFRSGVGTELTVEVGEHSVSVQRPDTATTRHLQGYAGRHTAPLPPEPGTLDLHLFLDSSSVELFAADGRVCLTDLLFPSAPLQEVCLQTQGLTLLGAELWNLSP